MIAISRVFDEDNMYYVGNTVTNERGYFKSNGDQINGDKISLTKEEISYRIWRQQQDSVNDTKLRKEWEKVKTHFTT